MQAELNRAGTAHGLDGSLVAPDWPPLTFDEVRGVLRSYPSLGKAKQLLTVSPRPFSAASVIETDREPIFIKRHYWAVRDIESLREEHRFMHHLRANGIGVPRVFAASSGQTAIKLGEWVYEVHETLPAHDLYGEAISWTPFRSVDHARAAGESMARLHRASTGFVASRRRPRPLIASFTIFVSRDPRAEFDRYVSSRPALKDYLQTRTCREETLALLAPFHSELLPLLPKMIPLWTHNDWHGSNLLWSDESQRARPVAVIDFGLADRTNVIHDLAHAIDRGMVEWLKLVEDPNHPERVPVHYDHLFAFLDGYQSERPLAPEEFAALPAMTALCHAEFALSETDYFLSILHSEEKAAMACEGYLVSHARWYQGPGAELLRRLRSWAAASASHATPRVRLDEAAVR